MISRNRHRLFPPRIPAHFFIAFWSNFLYTNRKWDWSFMRQVRLSRFHPYIDL